MGCRSGRTHAARTAPKGAAIYKNGQQISEPKLIRAVAKTLTETAEQHFEVFARAYREEWRAQSVARSAPVTGPSDADIQRQSARVDRMVRALADNDYSDAIARMLKVEETQLRELNARRASLAAPRPPALRSGDARPGAHTGAIREPRHAPRGRPGYGPALAEAFAPLVLLRCVDHEGSTGLLAGDAAERRIPLGGSAPERESKGTCQRVLRGHAMCLRRTGFPE